MTTPPNNNQTCPTCGGDGVLKTYIGKPPGPHYATGETCPTGNGTGVVAADTTLEYKTIYEPEPQLSGWGEHVVSASAYHRHDEQCKQEFGFYGPTVPPAEGELEQLTELDQSVLSQTDVELKGGRYVMYPRTLLALIAARERAAEERGARKVLNTLHHFVDEEVLYDRSVGQIHDEIVRQKAALTHPKGKEEAE